jgi:ribokinase
MKPLFTFGDLVMDVVARVPAKLEPDTDTPGEVQAMPGGSAANFAVWTARLGQPVRFAARVGDDLFGRALAADMAHEGVETYIALDPERPTAVLVLLAEGNQRHMLVPRGANHYLDASDIPEGAVRTAGWVHVTGYSYFWEATARAADRVLAIARETGIPISFDPSSAGFIRRHGLRVPAGTQVLIPNREEAEALTGVADPAAAARLLGETVPLVALKLGPDGALLCQEGRLTHVEPAEPDGPVVDTTGAGDAWGATFIALLRRGVDPVEAARGANRLAARLVTRMGARARIALPEGLAHQLELE